MDLKAIARPYSVGAVTLFYMPYRTLQVDIAVDELSKVYPLTSEWNIVQQTFALCAPLIVVAEFEGELTTEEIGLQAYWQNRNGNYSANYELFTQLLTAGICNVMWDGYTATRDNSIEAPPDLQPGDSDDPESEAATSTPSNS